MIVNKSLAAALVLLTLGSTGFTQNRSLTTHFTLSGKLTGQVEDSVSLNYEDIKGAYVRQARAVSHEGTFTFSGEISGPTMAYFSMKTKKSNQRGDDPNQVNIFLEPARMTLRAHVGDFKHAMLAGSKSQAELDQLNRLKAPVDLEMKQVLDEYYAEKDHEKAAEIREKFEPFNARKDKIDYDFFEEHPASYVTAYWLRFHVSKLSLEKLTYYYKRLVAPVRLSKYGEYIKEEILKLEAGSPGSKAADFSAVDINGQPLKLSDFMGKYVLLDFWASWCVPCRKSFPHLKELYHKYKYKGLEIVCISDDDSKPDLWRGAVTHDSIGMWHHVLRGLDRKKLLNREKNDNDLSQKFGIHVLPTKILIDPAGIIIGRYGGNGEEGNTLDKQLAELFK